METIKIKVADYDKVEYYRYMPSEIFNALELAQLRSAYQDKEILAEVPKHLFDKMVQDINNHKNKPK